MNTVKSLAISVALIVGLGAPAQRHSTAATGFTTTPLPVVTATVVPPNPCLPPCILIPPQPTPPPAESA